jgi:ATP-dependent Lon protease
MVSSTRKQNKQQKLQKVQDSDSETSDEEYIEYATEESSECDDDESIGSEDSESEDEDSVVEKRKSRHVKSRKYNDDSEEDETDECEIRKKIAKIFPSKYINSKVKRDNENKKRAFAKMEANTKKKNNKKKNNKKKNKRQRDESSSDEREDESSSDECDDESSSDECDDESSSDEVEVKETVTLSLLDLLGGNVVGVDDDDDEEALIDDENEICDSDDEKVFLKENYEVVVDITDDGIKEKLCKKNSNKKKNNNKKKSNEDDEVDLSDKFHDEYTELLDERKYRLEKLKKRPDSKVHKKALRECRKEMNNLIKTTRGSNTKGYYKLIHSQNQKLSGEIEYFKKKLSNKEQLQIMKDMKEINDHILVDKPHRLTLLQSDMPIKYKANVMQKVNMLKSMEPGDPEYYKVKNWVDDFMQVPFGKYSGLDVNMSHGIDKCNKFMEDAMKILDDCAYGLTEAKMQILQLVGQWISNPNAMGTAIAIKGPMGTGKTTLVKDGISKILQRYFAFIPLGGCGDGSFLEGHSYTYEGSGHGKIVQVLKESKSMNPVFYFDELDKVSESARGEEIIGILTHLTDTSQNNQFHDKYFANVDFDLSKSLFIFSYNDENRVNPILKDRMYCIHTKGYTTKEKLVIARDYILPKIREQVNFTNDEVTIPDETIEYIITNKNLTKEEDGVRNLKRCLEVIHTKINLFRLVKMDEDNMFSKEIKMKIVFPYTVKNDDVDKLIKSEPSQNQSVLASMYI